MIKFEFTPEVQEQVVQHVKWQQACCADIPRPEEPFNPWPGIAELMVQIAEGITPGWGSLEEIAIDFLYEHDDNSFYDNTCARYKTGALDTQELIERWESFKVLRQYSGF